MKKIKKKNKRMYFDQDVQDAIVEYNKEVNSLIRNKIYQEKIEYAFDKLCENIINTFKFSYFDAHFNDVKQEVLSFLVLNMHKYDASKGFKAFSYFSVVAKNYLIFHNNNNYKQYKLRDNIDSRIVKSKSVEGIDSLTKNADLLSEIIVYFENEIENIFKKDEDKLIAYAILNIIDNIDEIENFNKKAIYILLREMTNSPTAKLTRVINILKKKYVKLKVDFDQKGSVFK
jgi:hypothetical protein